MNVNPFNHDQFTGNDKNASEGRADALKGFLTQCALRRPSLTFHPVWPSLPRPRSPCERSPEARGRLQFFERALSPLARCVRVTQGRDENIKRRWRFYIDVFDFSRFFKVFAR